MAHAAVRQEGEDRSAEQDRRAGHEAECPKPAVVVRAGLGQAYQPEDDDEDEDDPEDDPEPDVVAPETPPACFWTSSSSETAVFVALQGIVIGSDPGTQRHDDRQITWAERGLAVRSGLVRTRHIAERDRVAVVEGVLVGRALDLERAAVIAADRDHHGRRARQGSGAGLFITPLAVFTVRS